MGRRKVFTKKNAFIGWLVLTLGKPAAKYKARQAVRGGNRKGKVAAGVAAAGATAGGVMFWRKRREQQEQAAQASESSKS
jgi:hypothetical protein